MNSRTFEILLIVLILLATVVVAARVLSKSRYKIESKCDLKVNDTEYPCSFNIKSKDFDNPASERPEL